jgi:hypothetical protein
LGDWIISEILGLTDRIPKISNALRPINDKESPEDNENLRKATSDLKIFYSVAGWNSGVTV